MIEGSGKKARILLEEAVRFRVGDLASIVGMRLQVSSRKAADQTILGMAETVMRRLGRPDENLFEIILVLVQRRKRLGVIRLPWVEIGSPVCSLHRPLSR